MYLGKDYIKELLTSCGYDAFEAYIVSSDYGKSKSDGSLYDVIKKEFGGNVVHIGDNHHADIVMAQKKGLSAIFYRNVNSPGNSFRPSDMSPMTASVYAGLVNSHLYNGLNRFGWEYEFGFIYGGLLITGFCRHIHKYVKDNCIDKILFLSRDGDVICKAYKLMYPEESSNCEYVLWSRLAAAKLCAKDYKYHFMARMIDYKINSSYTISDIFETMDLSFMSEGFIKEYDGSVTLTDILSKENAAKLKRYLNNNWQTVISYYDEEKEECLNYYNQILKGCRHALTVDSGWLGSGPIMLDNVLRETGCKISGVLLGTLSGQSYENDASCAMENSGSLNSYCFSSNLNRDIWKLHDASKGHNLIVELLLSSDNPSFRSFKKDSNGLYIFNKNSEKIDSAQIQEGILDFVKLFLKHIGDDINISGRDAICPVTILYRNDKWIKSLIKKAGININIE